MDLLVSGLLLVGLFFLLTGTLGLLRFRDVYSRMHATSKSTTLGVTGVLLAALLYLRFLGLSSGLKESLIIGFLFLTAPVGAHMIARAAHRAGIPLWQNSIVDELKAYREADHTAAEPISLTAPADPLSPPPLEEEERM
ncbi:MAG: monovalent cation/H(+) antiporter subunit G [Candidatus Binatia bacterium]|nr:monovalent cation/H(+) antiporter subunit G [Candidatus Binatia bacterium]